MNHVQPDPEVRRTIREGAAAYWQRSDRRAIRPDRAPYTVRERLPEERERSCPHHRWCIADRYNGQALLYTSIAQAQFACEHINANMAKEIMK